ncbi:hypothetical protein C7M84_003731 [Penaeus vannamei]|uniref:Uncharacterized protein n=1 Tax=Penaeus vannamei TaxID=6689 RepID=A0A423TMD0_PENVA|nr:hypothetical protein C7M84_003731 [Penaeus vannamei]
MGSCAVRPPPRTQPQRAVGEALEPYPLRARWWGSLAVAAAWLSLLPAHAHGRRQEARRQVRRALNAILGERARGAGVGGAGGNRDDGKRLRRRNIPKVLDVAASPAAGTGLREAVKSVRKAVDAGRIRLKSILKKVTLQQLLKICDLVEAAGEPLPPDATCAKRVSQCAWGSRAVRSQDPLACLSVGFTVPLPGSSASPARNTGALEVTHHGRGASGKGPQKDHEEATSEQCEAYLSDAEVEYVMGPPRGEEAEEPQVVAAAEGTPEENKAHFQHTNESRPNVKKPGSIACDFTLDISGLNPFDDCDDQTDGDDTISPSDQHSKQDKATLTRKVSSGCEGGNAAPDCLAFPVSGPGNCSPRGLEDSENRDPEAFCKDVEPAEERPVVAVMKPLPPNANGMQRYIIEHIIQQTSPCKGGHHFISLDSFVSEKTNKHNSVDAGSQRTIWSYEDEMLYQMNEMDGGFPSLGQGQTQKEVKVRTESSAACTNSSEEASSALSQSVSIISDKAANDGYKWIGNVAEIGGKTDIQQGDGQPVGDNLSQELCFTPQARQDTSRDDVDVHDDSYIIPSFASSLIPSRPTDPLGRHMPILNLTPPLTPSFSWAPKAKPPDAYSGTGTEGSSHCLPSSDLKSTGGRDEEVPHTPHSHNDEGWTCRKVTGTENMICVRLDARHRVGESTLASIFLVCLLEQDDGRVTEMLFTVPVPWFLKYTGIQTSGEGSFSKVLDKLHPQASFTRGHASKTSTVQQHRNMQQSYSAARGSPPKDPAQEREIDLLASYVLLGSPKLHDASSILEMIEEISPLPKELASNDSKRKFRTAIEFEETETRTKRARGTARIDKEVRKISDTPAHPVSLAFNVRTPSWILGHSFRPGPNSDPGHLHRKAPPSSPKLSRKVISHGRVRQFGARKPRHGGRSAKKRLRF